jgi:hypothetical protein
MTEFAEGELDWIEAITDPEEEDFTTFKRQIVTSLRPLLNEGLPVETFLSKVERLSAVETLSLMATVGLRRDEPGFDDDEDDGLYYEEYEDAAEEDEDLG